MGTVTYTVVPEHELVWYRPNFESFFDMDDSALVFDHAVPQGRLPFFEAIGSREGERRWANHVGHHARVGSPNMIREMVEELAGEAPGVIPEIRVFPEPDQALEWLGICDYALPSGGGGAEKPSDPPGDEQRLRKLSSCQPRGTW